MKLLYSIEKEAPISKEVAKEINKIFSFKAIDLFLTENRIVRVEPGVFEVDGTYVAHDKNGSRVVGRLIDLSSDNEVTWKSIVATYRLMSATLYYPVEMFVSPKNYAELEKTYKSPRVEICRCDIRDLMTFGHVDGCVEKK